jgi:phosphomannomutase/phosphoglucomutase
MLDPSIFRRYDIRGVAGRQLTEDVARVVGQALGTRIRRTGEATAAVGRDVRHSSPALAAAVIEGLVATGIEVMDLGVVPTPVVYHALYRLDLGGGVMVTGSHNPKEDNGLKLCLGPMPLYGDAVATLRTQAESLDFERGRGSVEATDYLSVYLDEVCGMFSFPPGLRVAVDCGNGVMGPVVLSAFGRLGIDVVPLYCEPDGDFPNHIPDPEVPKYMAELGRRVQAEGCACGLGFDGDGDRVGILDENGRKISADWLIALFARDLLTRYPGGRVRFDVKCSDFLADDIRAHGGIPVMGETGHSLLKRDVVAEDCILGGELSGHIVFNRGYVPIDDALFGALSFLKLLVASKGKASALFAHFPVLSSTPEIKVPCPDAVKFRVVEALVETFREDYEVLDLDGARVRFDGGWFLVRASNTTPNLTVRLEAESDEILEQARQILFVALRAHPEVGAEALLEIEA